MIAAPPFLRVVEMADARTAVAGRLLVGLGASVLRVLPPTGDPLAEDPLAYVHYNAGKVTVSLDLEQPADRERFHELLGSADVLLDGDARRNHQRLLRLHPRLVHISITPFGLTGPRRNWLSTDLVSCALGGMTAMSGDPDGPPLAPPRRQAEQLAGANAAIGALLGVLARRRGAHGQLVEVSVHESVAASLEFGALSYIHQGRVHKRGGSRYAHVPHKLFPCLDGWVAGGFGGSPRMWTDLLAWLIEEGMGEDLAEPRWQDEPTRSAEREHIYQVLDRFTSRHRKDALAAEARRRRLPWAAVASPADVLANPQLEARRFFIELSHARAAPALRDAGFAYSFPAALRPLRLRVPSPAGEAVPTEWAGPAPAAAPPRGAARPSGPALEGVRVLDLTWVLAGPYATRILADHGADVIKVESRHRPDPSRFTSALHFSRDPSLHPDRSGYFNNFNRNKRSLTLNLRQPKGVAVLERLVELSDVLIENFSAGALERLGLGEPRLQELRPDLIVVRMSGLGQSGPWHDCVTYGDTLTAMSGMTGEARVDDLPPAGVAFGLGDMIAANHAALGVLAALEYRARSGRGVCLDLSQLEAVVAQMGTALLEPSDDPGGARAGAPDQRRPAGVYPCAGDDRWCAIEVEDDAQLASLRKVLEYEGEDLESQLAAWTQSRRAKDVMRRLQRAGVPAGMVQDGRDLVEYDEQLRARGFYVELGHPLAGRFLHEGMVARLSETPGAVVRPAPCLGEHTREVLTDLLEMTNDEIERLEAAGVLE